MVTRRRFVRRRRVPVRRRPVVRKLKFKRKSRITNTVGNEYGPFPPRYKAILTYRENQSLASTAGSFASYTYRLNDLYDPRYAAGGSQPRGFDTLCAAGGGSAPYSWFVVRGAKLKVTLCNNTTFSGYCGFAISVGSTNIPTSYTDIMESRYAKVRHVTKSGGSRDQLHLSMYIPMFRAFGVSKRQIIDDADYHGNYGATPTDVCFVTLFWLPDTADSATLIGDCLIDYYSEFFNPNKLTQS